MDRCLGGDLAFGFAETDGSAGIDDLGDADANAASMALRVPSVSVARSSASSKPHKS